MNQSKRVTNPRVFARTKLLPQPLPVVSAAKAYWMIGAMALAATGCSTMPPPTEQMAVSRAAVADADSADAATYAAVELQNAHQRLDAANVAMGAKVYVNARRYAEEAEADANLAATQARSAKAQRAVAEVRESLRALREEMVRNAQY